VVVGWSSDGVAVRWVRDSEGGWKVDNLGTLGGRQSWAYGVSADGGVIVGKSKNNNNRRDRACRWVQDALGNWQAQDLNNVYTNLLNGSELREVRAISGDGWYLVGSGYNANARRTEAFLLDRHCVLDGDINGDGRVDENDLQIVQRNLGLPLILLGTLGGNEGYALGVSNDGSVVVGYSRNANGYMRAYRWTRTTGMQDLGTLGGNESWGNDVSADGLVVVGAASLPGGGSHAFRWTAETGMQDLGTFLGGRPNSSAYCISDDGKVVVGFSYTPEVGFYYAMRWTQEAGMEDLGSLPGGGWSNAYAVSADGTVIVGASHDASGTWRACRWIAEAQNLHDLGLPGGRSIAYGVSPDGSVVVGTGRLFSGNHRPFRWTLETGGQDLGTFGGAEGIALDASWGGSIIVGRAQDARGIWRAFRWTQARGLEDLNLTYGTFLPAGWILWSARVISWDGRYIAGTAYHAGTNRYEPYLLYTEPLTRSDGDVNADGRVDEADLQIVQRNLGRSCP
jgi:probable HAF family extracellular repeat protein